MKKKDKDTLDMLVMVLLVVGGLNWGVVGLLGADVVAMVFGPMSMVAKVIYLLVGLAAVYGGGKMLMKWMK